MRWKLAIVALLLVFMGGLFYLKISNSDDGLKSTAERVLVTEGAEFLGSFYQMHILDVAGALKEQDIPYTSNTFEDEGQKLLAMRISGFPDEPRIVQIYICFRKDEMRNKKMHFGSIDSVVLDISLTEEERRVQKDAISLLMGSPPITSSPGVLIWKSERPQREALFITGAENDRICLASHDVEAKLKRHIERVETLKYYK